MTVKKKSNTAYYLCQFLGLCIVLTSGALGLYFDPQLQAPEFQNSASYYFLKNTLSYASAILLTHYVLRNYQFKNQETTLSAFLKIIFLCTLISTLIDKPLEWAFTLPEPDMFIYQNGIIIEFFFYLLINSIFFITWSFLYLTITSIRDRRKLAEQLKEQQLASLMNQINPHFLFNSLNTIRGMIYEDEDKAAELITQLSTCFVTTYQLIPRPTLHLGKN